MNALSDFAKTQRSTSGNARSWKLFIPCDVPFSSSIWHRYLSTTNCNFQSDTPPTIGQKGVNENAEPKPSVENVLEECTYLDMKLNVGLKDDDFVVK